MKKLELRIEGNGAYGKFLRTLLEPHCNFPVFAHSVILAVPISAYQEIAAKFKGHHLINVCSVQGPSNDICWKYTDKVTCIHTLFGPRTPAEYRNTLITARCNSPEEAKFLEAMSKVSKLHKHDEDGLVFTPESHDRLMAKTHLAAILIAKQAKVIVDRAADVPDHLLPHSFRQMKNLVQTLEDMPQGTLESIMANPNF